VTPTLLLALSAFLFEAGEAVAASAAAPRARPGMVVIGPGIYRPFYPSSDRQRAIPIVGFQLDRLPVTNGDFLAFVKANPRWRRDRVGRLFAEPGYLVQWAKADAPGAGAPSAAPVVHVSWFAAKAYCAARGARLPRESEWEVAAQASETTADGHLDPAVRRQVLDWYARPTPARLPLVGKSRPNYFGIHDLHALVWEWVLDFNSQLISADDRERGDKEVMRFCGVGALDARDPGDYASFMRLAFRSSLRPDSVVRNLGFRCAADLAATAGAP